MSTVYNVSDITNILSGTIQRNVLVQGEVEILTDGPPSAFYLINESNKLRCFIPQGVIVPKLKQGQVVVVDGKITLFSSFSQYQIKVSNIQNTEVNRNKFSVTEITNEILRLLARTPELKNIQIQGKVLEVFEAAVSNWDLCDVDGSPALQIKCVRPGPIGIPVQVGNNVYVRGEVGIYPPQSRYEIKVADIDPVTEASTPICQCPGCESCHPRGGNQSCPSLQDPEYELCADCYHESPDREDRVVQTVYAYFDALGGNGFSPQKERQIQMGASNRKADVVLVNGNESFAAIAECKGAGYVGHGRAQLNGYLSASNTRFGIFANRADPSQWEFYKEQGQNQYQEITCDQFKEEIRNLTDRDLQSARNQIATLTSENNQFRRIQQDVQEELEEVQISLRSATRGIDRASTVISENVPNPSSGENE